LVIIKYKNKLEELNQLLSIILSRYLEQQINTNYHFSQSNIFTIFRLFISLTNIRNKTANTYKSTLTLTGFDLI